MKTEHLSHGPHKTSSVKGNGSVPIWNHSREKVFFRVQGRGAQTLPPPGRPPLDGTNTNYEVSRGKHVEEKGPSVRWEGSKGGEEARPVERGKESTRGAPGCRTQCRPKRAFPPPKLCHHKGGGVGNGVEPISYVTPPARCTAGRENAKATSRRLNKTEGCQEKIMGGRLTRPETAFSCGRRGNIGHFLLFTDGINSHSSDTGWAKPKHSTKGGT